MNDNECSIVKFSLFDKTSADLCCCNSNGTDIKKADVILGKDISFRNAQLRDAEFILSLRLDEEKSKYLSKVSNELLLQEKWLDDYSRSSSQAYFVIENKKKESIGTVRIYDKQNESFCWGSWILSSSASNTAAIESALIVYSYALKLGFRAAHFDVRKENSSVCKFHERFGAIKIGESDIDVFYSITLDSILKSVKKYSKYLPEGITVINFTNY